MAFPSEQESDPYSESCLECLEGLRDDPTVAVTPDGEYGSVTSASASANEKMPSASRKMTAVAKKTGTVTVASSAGLLRLELPTPKVASTTINNNSKTDSTFAASTPGQDLLDWCKQVSHSTKDVFMYSTVNK